MEVDGGGVVVEHEVRAGPDLDVAPCATSGSTEWHLAEGSTVLGATEVLALYNPFADDAIVDVRVTTDEGRVDPPDLVGLVIEAGTLDVVDLGAHVRRQAHGGRHRRRPHRPARRRPRPALRRHRGPHGRGPCPRLAERRGRVDVPGRRVGPGTGRALPRVQPGRRRRPRDHRAGPPGRRAVEPVELTVGPAGRGHLRRGRRRPGPGRGGALGGGALGTAVPVVVERELEATRGPFAGWTASPGARRAATRWAFAAGEARTAVDRWLVAVAAGDGPATVTFAPAGGDGAEVTVAPGGPPGTDLAGRVATAAPSPPAIATGSAPIVVERVLLGTAGGLATSIGVPLG